MKIGLYLQDYRNCSEEICDKDLTNAKKRNIDLLVFPETCYIPYGDDFYEVDIFENNDGIRDHAMLISQEIGCAVIIGASDVNGYIYNIYANAFASEEETGTALYIKHTMSKASPLEFDNYDELIDAVFCPIILQSKKIGMTICYDCNHSLFSRAYGKQNIDIIINSTGGNIVYDKWYRYNRVRALENHCFTFCTMGYCDDKRPNSYTYGFTPAGRLIIPDYIYDNNSEWDRIGNIAVYDTDKTEDGYEDCYNLNQKETDNEKGTMLINPDIFKAEKNNGIYSYEENGLKYIIVKENNIMLPEKILKEMYDTKEKGIKYLIINIWDKLDRDYYNKVLEDVLRVRSMENFCAVMMISPEMTKCFQCGDNRTSQVIRKNDGKYRLDLKRMGGPEAIWKNKRGMRSSWRSGYEVLIDYLNGI
ncbi:MAG: nitrilase-related carbon-nitrogen hydrolase [Candidatus Ornithomonoglobus sp.]